LLLVPYQVNSISLVGNMNGRRNAQLTYIKSVAISEIT
jgi:hypothetical protein